MTEDTYIVLKSTESSALEGYVNAALRAGYTLAGGLSTGTQRIPDGTGKYRDETWLYQALIKA